MQLHLQRSPLARGAAAAAGGAARRAATAPRRARAAPRAGPADAEIRQMEELKAGLAAKLEAAARPAPPAPPAPGADARDLRQVGCDEYFDVVKAESAGGRVLVMDFYTQWCGPCKIIKPTLCDWAEEWAGRGVQIFKFEAAKENAAVGKACAIKSVPTFIVYRDGEEVSRMTGKDEAKLRKLIVEAAGPLLA